MKIRAKDGTMKAKGKSGLVPKRRFPEFRQTGDWEKKELREVATIIRKKAGSNKYTLMSVTAGVGLISQLEKFGREIAGAQYKNYLVIEHNDFAYNKSATKEYPEGFIGMYSGNEPGAVPNSIFTCFRVDTNAVVPKYLNYLFFWNLHGKWLNKFITVGARAHGSLNIDDNDLLALPVPFPRGSNSITEQQKIAACLSSLDELIAAQAHKLYTLKAHKKGLMQQLFPNPGQTTPTLRFPEFRDAGEWTSKKLGKLSIILRGGSPRPINSYLTNDANGLNWLKIGDVDKESKYIVRTEDRVKVEALNKTRVVKPGDLIMSNSMSFGRPYILRIETCIHDGWIAVTEITNKLNRNFLYYLILSAGAQTYFMDAAAGGGIRNLNADIIKQLPVSYPKSEAEQQKIAACLSSLDELIAAQAHKLYTLKAHKKGLMQQLFPNPDEVVG